MLVWAPLKVTQWETGQRDGRGQELGVAAQMSQLHFDALTRLIEREETQHSESALHLFRAVHLLPLSSNSVLLVLCINHNTK